MAGLDAAIGESTRSSGDDSMESQGPNDDIDRSERSSGNPKREALMKLIAEEMVNSLMGKEDGDEGNDDDMILKTLQAKLLAREKARKAKRKARRRSKRGMPPRTEDVLSSPTGANLENLYYSHIGGQGSSHDVMSSPAPSGLLSSAEELEELGDTPMKDNDSFAGGHLHELVDDKHRPLNSASSGGYSTGESATKSTMSDSKDSTIRSRDLSIDEIRQYVMDNIPQAVRDQIPQEAWGQIFQAESKGSKTSKTSTLPTKGSVEKLRKEARAVPPAGKPRAPVDHIVVENTDDDELDDITVFSDVSGLTGAFPDGKYVEQRREVLSKPASDLARVEEGSQNSSQRTPSQRPASHRSHQSAPVAPGEDQRQKQAQPRNSLAIMPGEVAALEQPLGVRFDQVEVRYYERIVTDNPAVQSGPPIGIGWKYKKGGRVDVDYWEQSRGKARYSVELVLPRHVRERMLRDAGVSQKEMADMVRATLKVKNQRKQTFNNLSTAGVEEAVEKARKRLGRLLSLSK